MNDKLILYGLGIFAVLLNLMISIFFISSFNEEQMIKQIKQKKVEVTKFCDKYNGTLTDYDQYYFCELPTLTLVCYESTCTLAGGKNK